jgi:DNA-binding GntR family transcriptional regulator
MIRASAITQTERVYSALRSDILAGRRRPGTRLLFADLTADYCASMGVVREALSRLTAEALVESEPQVGFRVRSLSLVDLQELTEARIAIETLVLRQAVAQGDLTWESEVLAAHHRIEKTPLTDASDPERVSDAWAHAHAAFHATLLNGCPNSRLRAIASGLRDSAELYRRWSVPLSAERRDVAAEHRAVLEAVVDRDADQAASTLKEHISHTTQLLLEAEKADKI